MPHIAPPGGEVDWPRGEGTLGVVGVAPWATIDFLKAFYARWSATKDWHYPRVLTDINTKLPSRGRHLELGETDPSPFIAQSIAELAAQGATVVVVPCNTAHLLYERWSAGSAVPLPHIVRETAQALAGDGAQRVAALTSASLRRHGLYERCFGECGLQPVDIGDAAAEIVVAAIDAVKRTGVIDPKLRQSLQALLHALVRDGVQGVALGCTELASLAPLCRDAGLAVAESNDGLAAAALRLIQGPSSGEPSCLSPI
jgi:aspartate racemase